jgi:hypothetical protein
MHLRRGQTACGLWVVFRSVLADFNDTLDSTFLWASHELIELTADFLDL